MLLIRRPKEDFIRATLAAQRAAPFTYDQVGATRHSNVPDGFAVNQWKSVLGRGHAWFERAKQALCDYRMLQLGWLQHVGPVEPLAAGALVGTLARYLGAYSLNVARVVYVEDEQPTRFGFGYGTLAEYPLQGEERFTIEIDEATRDVTFEIFSFARANTLLMKLAWPFLRRAQRRFCVESSRALQDASRPPGE